MRCPLWFKVDEQDLKATSIHLTRTEQNRTAEQQNLSLTRQQLPLPLLYWDTWSSALHYTTLFIHSLTHLFKFILVAVISRQPWKQQNNKLTELTELTELEKSALLFFYLGRIEGTRAGERQLVGEGYLGVCRHWGEERKDIVQLQGETLQTARQESVFNQGWFGFSATWLSSAATWAFFVSVRAEKW